MNQQEHLPEIKQTRSRFSKILSYFFIFAGFLWLGWLLAQDSLGLMNLLQDANWQWVAISFLLGGLSILPNGIVFHILLREQKTLAHSVSLRYSMQLMFVGQMIRHLPGRFWGLAYQINQSRAQIHPLTLIKVNLDFTLIYLGFNIFVPLVILLSYQFGHFLSGLLLFLSGSAFFIFWLRLNWVYSFFQFLRRFIPYRLENRLNQYFSMEFAHQYSWLGAAQIWLIVCFSWVIYLLAWQTFSCIFPSLVVENMFVLCATYSLAWVVGFLSMVTPAGLGIREAVFLFLSGNMINETNMAFLALFARVWLLALDLLIFLFVFTINKGKFHAK